jgi:hypothetical protein
MAWWMPASGPLGFGFMGFEALVYYGPGPPKPRRLVAIDKNENQAQRRTALPMGCDRRGFKGNCWLFTLLGGGRG